jgi:hypothetical protein
VNLENLSVLWSFGGTHRCVGLHVGFVCRFACVYVRVSAFVPGF